MLLSIIIPTFNEEKTILHTLKRVNAVNLSSLGIKKELIVINDCSKDNTLQILKDNSNLYTTLLTQEVNQGKGRSIRTGLTHSNGDVFIIQDADDEYSPEEYSKLLEPIIRGETKVVYGSRFLDKEKLEKHKWAVPSHYIGNKLLSLVTSILYFRRITDMETCYKVFTKEVLNSLSLKSKRFDFEPEITAKIIKNKFKIVEIPISYKSRPFEEGKKINWKDGIKAIFYLFKYRFVN